MVISAACAPDTEVGRHGNAMSQRHRPRRGPSTLFRTSPVAHDERLGNAATQRHAAKREKHVLGSAAGRNASRTKFVLPVLATVALSAVVAAFALGGSTGESAAAACNANAKAVETAVSMFQIEHSGMTPTSALLTTTANGGPILTSWPNGGTRYAITLNPEGQVMIAVPTKATAVPYDQANPCGKAA